MKHIIILLLLIISINSYSQDSDKSVEKAIIDVVNQFFESLEKQDTILMKKIVFIDGQIWRVRNNQNKISYDMRYFKDDLKSFNSKETLLETPLSFEIKIHNEIAMAWVPYEFRINGEFSHCGIDVFTLIYTREGWKIVNASYTIDKKGCEELKKQ
ncbi:nuclear transport factor 2 family protein [Formosa maritima]|uniref:Nuclear transport factor 2 family protein n=1 Tax=Formosa maritima TaxID=2592046 RepID=A0A5D0G8L4_9FLAO|nr:nuclear transport factor 2 family protein [Formosa maritima]TYA55278.1 nuclear transport factor 2 family protein [Formosa maritima]